jgi:prepilin-type N-terminal cleavage/methylation domain-containing protein
VNGRALVTQRGVTIPEVLVAIVILAVGLLGLGASGLHITAMLTRGERAGAVATFGARRMELLRAAACLPGAPTDGTEQLTRGGAVLAANTWTTSVVDGGIFQIRVVSRSTLTRWRVRADTIETVVVCR